MKGFLESVAGLALVAIVFLIVTFPATWLLMLFVGHLGLGMSYWGSLPLGILVSALIGTASSGAYVRP